MDFHDDSESTPDNFICPITLEVMKNPVKDPVTRRSFEKKAIVEWLDSNGICPMSRRPMEPEELVYDKHLKKQIREWKQERQEGTNSPNGQKENGRPKSDLWDIRSRVLAKRDQRISTCTIAVGNDELNDASMQHQQSLGCLVAQNFECCREKQLQAFGISQDESNLSQLNNSESSSQFVGGDNKNLSSKISDILSTVVDDILEEM